MRKMTAEQFQAALDSLGVTHGGFGRLVDLNERTVRRMANNEREVMQSIAMLIWLIEKYDVTLPKLLKLMSDKRDPASFGDQRLRSE
ncbi:hypothetical protein [Bradyrhizobium paxllaeri]|uniref:hypothetical protein n=1 Tax=Bradyrhizobium paxllaeri TaxID=190148 RepID=UPI00081051E6|nr:hypothetical protein [Bradyrhizobium paxllaeri]